MSVYGLTGGIGVGKSTVASMFQEAGIPVVFADEVGRMVVAKGSDGLAEIVESFGTEVLDAAITIVGIVGRPQSLFVA